MERWKKEKHLKWTNYQNNKKIPTKENVWGPNIWKGAKEKQWYSLLIFFLEVVDNFSNHLWEKGVWKIISFKGTFATQ
jgi:hypothetical protein